MMKWKRLRRAALASLAATLGLALAYTPSAQAVSSKIALTEGMVTNESGLGDAGDLVDEQTAAGDPKNGTGGAPTSNWFPGWGSSPYPASAYIDLGQLYDLSDIYIRDINDIGNLTISTGTPGSWTPLFTDSLGNYNAWNAHAVTVTTRYVRVTKAGQSSNVGEIVLYGSPAGSGGGGDATAPSAVSNLAAGSPSSASLQLTWTAPGDDGGSGTAASYDIRYSTSLITAANWGSASQASGEPAPAVAGTPQSYTLSGLNASTAYYVALKTRDEANNESALSNVASGTTSATGGGGGGKIVLTEGMILNETTKGDATRLVNEQSAAGDPKAGAGGHPTQNWQIDGNSIYLPASAVIDLGTDYALTDVYLYDSNGSGNVSVSVGTPFAWTPLVTDGMGGYNQWKGHAVSATTRYVQVTFASAGVSLNEIVLYGTAHGTPAAPPQPTVHTPPALGQFIGINAFIDDPLDKMQVAGFVREYHNWNWDEGDVWPFGTISTSYPGYPNNANKFNPSYAGGGWNFDAYYAGLKNAGITAVPAIQGSVSWLTTGGNHKPLTGSENALLPASYAEHADHMFQYAARYGGAAVADSKLKLAVGQPRSTGLGTLSYYENWNEQDKWWDGRASYFNPYEYAAMTSADYDGHQGTMGTTVGVKNADPNAKLVMGGLADPNLEYVRALKFWSDFNRGGSFPVDVINIHHYSNNGGGQGSGSVGISPEADGLKEKLQKFVDYRNAYLPGKEVWLTEFGYDTHPSSPQRAPAIGVTNQEEVQGRWLIRSYLAAAAAGIDRAAMYMLRDVNPNSSTQYDTSGLVSSQATGYQPKPSWYYVYTMKNKLGNMRYLGEAASGNPNVKIYKFKDVSSNQGAYVVWSPTSNNTTVNGYGLSLAGSPTSATLVTLTGGDTDGVNSTLAITGGSVSVNVSEKPVFVMVDAIQ